MKTRFGLAAVLLLGLSLLATGSAAAKDKANTEFNFHIGDAFLAAATGNPANGNGDVAKAANGDTITIQGSGEFDTKNGTADGEGTFVHRTAAGTVLATGTWEAKRLSSFHDAGTSTNLAFPRTFHAGEAVLLVQVVGHPAGDPDSTVRFDATLSVFCELPGAGTAEGVTFNAGFINFNTRVSGVTVFVAGDDD
jgi:hypothetical protein